MAAHIPYGYQIINGKAIINEEEAVKLNILFETCASGSSILSGIQKSGIGKKPWPSWALSAGSTLPWNGVLSTDYRKGGL